MLYQTTVSYSLSGTEEIRSNLGVKLHGSLMNLIPEKMAEELHQSLFQPFSLYALNKGEIGVVKVCGLTDQAKIICNAFANEAGLEIFGMDCLLTKICSMEENPVTPNEAAEKIPNRLRLKFVTPAAIKQNKKISATTSLEKYFRSVAEKYAFFEKQDNIYEEFCLHFSRLRIENFSLKSEGFNLGGNILSGLVGYVDLDISRDKGILRKILAYSLYSGVGAKTAMGMGGITIEEI